jgi:hypothetical protein
MGIKIVPSVILPDGTVKVFHGATVVVSRPRWEDVYNGYPMQHRGTYDERDETKEQVFRSILGEKYDTKTFNNACATRVSIALINAHMTVRRDFRVQVGEHAGKGFIASASELHRWLSEPDNWNTADITVDKSDKNMFPGKTNLEIIREKIGGRKGVYIILGGFKNGITGHATLWTGNDVVGGKDEGVDDNTYSSHIDKGATVYFWELKGNTDEDSGSDARYYARRLGKWVTMNPAEPIDGKKLRIYGSGNLLGKAVATEKNKDRIIYKFEPALIMPSEHYFEPAVITSCECDVEPTAKVKKYPTGVTVISKKIFEKMLWIDQYCYLKQKFNESISMETDEKGILASNLRGLRDSLKLDELFKHDNTFMNVALRDFLNLNNDGTEEYFIDKLEALTREWKETISIGATLHQTNVGGSYLNAKFIHKQDGREVVFDYNGVVVKSYPDKGTFNYVSGNALSVTQHDIDGGHYKYDMAPYYQLMNEMGITVVGKMYAIPDRIDDMAPYYKLMYNEAMTSVKKMHEHLDLICDMDPYYKQMNDREIIAAIGEMRTLPDAINVIVGGVIVTTIMGGVPVHLIRGNPIKKNSAQWLPKQGVGTDANDN